MRLFKRSVARHDRTVILDELSHPLALAPLAGGPSTPELTAAVANTGAFAFLAGGYLSGDDLAERLRATRALTDRPFGVNLFVPGHPSPSADVDRYSHDIAADVEAAGASLGDARFDDDAWAAKIALLYDDPVSVVSFTFGNPDSAVIDRLRSVGSEVWLTVNSPDEADGAMRLRPDALVVQGTEAGGHQGGPSDAGGGYGLLALLQLVGARASAPLVAAGGISTGRAVAAVLAAGASCAAVGSAFLRCPEAGTSAVHRAALAAGTAPTDTTRAFTGRTARGISNRFMQAHRDAPRGYPEIHHLTAPMRQLGRTSDNPDLVNLWAGEGYALGTERPAAEVVADLAAGARDALAEAANRWSR
jgi:nitronate monooxygenase